MKFSKIAVAVAVGSCLLSVTSAACTDVDKCLDGSTCKTIPLKQCREAVSGKCVPVPAGQCMDATKGEAMAVGDLKCIDSSTHQCKDTTATSCAFSGTDMCTPTTGTTMCVTSKGKCANLKDYTQCDSSSLTGLKCDSSVATANTAGECELNVCKNENRKTPPSLSSTDQTDVTKCGTCINSNECMYAVDGKCAPFAGDAAGKCDASGKVACTSADYKEDKGVQGCTFDCAVKKRKQPTTKAVDINACGDCIDPVGGKAYCKDAGGICIEIDATKFKACTAASPFFECEINHKVSGTSCTPMTAEEICTAHGTKVAGSTKWIASPPTCECTQPHHVYNDLTGCYDFPAEEAKQEKACQDGGCSYMKTAVSGKHGTCGPKTGETMYKDIAGNPKCAADAKKDCEAVANAEYDATALKCNCKAAFPYDVASNTCKASTSGTVTLPADCKALKRVAESTGACGACESTHVTIDGKTTPANATETCYKQLGKDDKCDAKGRHKLHDLCLCKDTFKPAKPEEVNANQPCNSATTLAVSISALVLGVASSVLFFF